MEKPKPATPSDAAAASTSGGASAAVAGLAAAIAQPPVVPSATNALLRGLELQRLPDVNQAYLQQVT